MNVLVHLPQLLVLKSERMKNKYEHSIVIISFDKCFFYSALLHPVSTTGIHQLHWSRSLTRDLSLSLPYTVLHMLDFISTQHCLTLPKVTITLKLKLCGKQALLQFWLLEDRQKHTHTDTHTHCVLWGLSIHNDFYSVQTVYSIPLH